jgi:hypothetical protein
MAAGASAGRAEAAATRAGMMKRLKRMIVDLMCRRVGKVQ